MLLDGKVIVITGGAGLIGQEFAKAVMSQGGIAVIADIDEERIQYTVKELAQKFPSGKIDAFKLNVISKDSLQECINYVDRKYKKIDALINNAYPRNENYGRHFFDVEYDDFVENLGLNLGGYFTTSQVFSKYFKRQGYGNIVNISSVYGVIAPRFEIYKDQVKLVDPSKVLGFLATNSKDLILPGYPYGLIKADKFARVTENEIQFLRTKFNTKLNRNVRESLNLNNVHKVLDSIY